MWIPVVDPNVPPPTLGGLPWWQMMQDFKEGAERLAMDQQDAFHQRVHFRQQNPGDLLSGQPLPVALPCQPRSG